MPITAEDVLEIVTVLQSAGVRLWLDGGWGVDALLGEQTRPHADLDIAVATPDLGAMLDSLNARGFTVVRVDSQFNAVLVDHRGRQVDYHLVDLGATCLAADGTQTYGPRGLPYDVDALEGIGHIAGQTVPCCTAAFQAKSHAQGYEPDDDDYRDVLALHRRFGTPLFPPYDVWPGTGTLPG